MSKSIPMWLDRGRGGCAISIETQAYCNKACPECPRTLDPTRSRWYPGGKPIKDRMPTKKVYDLIDQAAEMGWQGPIHFSLYSEPLLDSRFIDFCKYAKRKGLKPELYTNGILLDNKMIRQVDGLCDYVVLSFRSLGTLQYWKSKFNKSRVKVCDKYHVLIWNPNEELLKKGIAKAINNPCNSQLFVAFRIQYNGQMMLCYADFNNDWGLLNAFDHTLEELWYGKEHVAAIEALSKPGSRQKFSLCRQCPEVYPDGGYYVQLKRKLHPDERERFFDSTDPSSHHS